MIRTEKIQFKLSTINGVCDKLYHFFLNGYKVFAFYGTLGVGKTTLIKHFCLKMGVIDQTSSPSFSVLNPYLTKDKKFVYHFDFYRLNQKSEAYEVGILDYFHSDDCCLIEWAQIVADELPDKTLSVFLETTSNQQERIAILKYNFSK